MLGARRGRFVPLPASHREAQPKRGEELAVYHETLQADGSLPRE